MRRVNPVRGYEARFFQGWDALIRSEPYNARTGRFGWTRTGEDGKPRFHEGLDLLCEPGDPIFAAHAGRVVRTGEQHQGRGYGWRIYLLYEGERTITRYAHMAAQFVQVNDLVRAGDQIGTAGRSGNVADGAKTHLHFEVLERVDVSPLDILSGTPVDPLSWLQERFS